MVWKPDANKKCGKRHGSPPNYPAYITCIHSHLQKNKKAIIEFRNGMKPDSIHRIAFEYEDQEDTSFKDDDTYHRGSKGYQFPCKGDSGGGHWVEQGIAHGKRLDRAVLVGITTSGDKDDRCGGFIHMQKTIDSDILHFIKVMVKLSNI